ncbi:hypothetical protein RIF25_12970 [Thermosynechococcaceae cyanobacterium BACA0444]|uniref:Uncharacterized protein n=1 Tax=Pseudocalidococcus azoricus BACA0444 TaxID=2918990 RepID=A0AAE4FVJ8_9CYAN|nr:hypothetical protein [Pseudocalidococcus azoricus]MDS3861715.1 hypothetical protein [Pseudocalidococcus azoricus BACA0444]
MPPLGATHPLLINHFSRRTHDTPRLVAEQPSLANHQHVNRRQAP